MSCGLGFSLLSVVEANRLNNCTRRLRLYIHLRGWLILLRLHWLIYISWPDNSQLATRKMKSVDSSGWVELSRFHSAKVIIVIHHRKISIAPLNSVPWRTLTNHNHSPNPRTLPRCQRTQRNLPHHHQPSSAINHLHPTHHGLQHRILNPANQRSAPPNGAPYTSLTVPDNCKWYFGHEVQVITFRTRATGKWSAIVYPADCVLASASSDDIHLHASSLPSLYTAVKNVRNITCDLIGDRFLLKSGDVAPVLHNYEAPCNCLQQTASLTVVQHGGQGVGGDSSATADQHRGPEVEAGVAPDIFPVLDKIQSTLDGIEQQMHLRPVGNAALRDGTDVHHRDDPTAHGSEPVITPTANLNLIPQASGVLSVCSSVAGSVEENYSRPSTPAAFQDLPLGMSSFPYNSTTEGRVVASVVSSTESCALLDDPDEHIREVIRMEIGRVLAGAMGSLAGSGHGGGT